MELKNLKTFYYASRFLNYSRTAEYLNFTQPAVSLQIKNLEDELGQPLFMRIGKQTFLTPAGEILAKHVQTIFNSIDHIKQDLALLEHPIGSLTIAADISFCTNNLQPIISQFYKNNPQVKTKILSWNSRRVIKDIEKNEVDVGFISGNYQNDKVEEIQISNDPIVLVASKNCLDGRSQSKIIHSLPLIKYLSDSPYSEFIETFIKKNKLDHKDIIEFNNLEAVKSAVLHNVGIAPLTQDVVVKEIKNGSLMTLSSKSYRKVDVKTSMIYLKEKSNWQSIHSLKELVTALWINTDQQN